MCEFGRTSYLYVSKYVRATSCWQSGLKIRPCRALTVAANRHKDDELPRLARYLGAISALEDFTTLDHRKWERYLERAEKGAEVEREAEGR